MEKVLTIDERKVTFKADGATPLRYRAQFNRDYFADIISITNSLKDLNTGEADLSKINTTIFSDIIYLLAKTADKEIGDIFDWYGSFDSFPVFEVFGELQELMMANMQQTVKKAKKK